MKKGEKRLILILLIILVILIIIKVNSGKTNNEEEEVSETVTSTTSTEETYDDEGYVETLEDGTRVNQSAALHETKTIDGIEITDIELTESGNVTQFVANATNKSGEIAGGYPVVITFLDEDGNEIATMNSYIKELEADETCQITTTIVFDYTDAYDFTITK